MIWVILLKDIEGLGKRYEVKRVSPGYARNFLFPKGWAVIANEENMKKIKKKEKEYKEKIEKELKEIQKLASELDGLEVVFSVRTKEDGSLFEKITAQKICEKLKRMGYRITKKQILLPQIIQEPGEFLVRIKLPHNLESELKIIVNEEK